MVKLSSTEVAFYVALGKNVKRARDLGCLNQKTVARMLNVGPQEVCKWEYGQLRMNASDLVKLAEATCVSIDSLLDGTRGLAEQARLVRQPVDWRKVAA